ncbi:ArsR/SmtB family transcription factor [Sphingomonas crusticola]|uniref:ArsR/SmtB family transcription factor n=1 Tax=Sphingomonas crusticola TaxID=1697973 RepID=UPI000E27E107|nr:metalloregulator ArsR/SmtB family transcription factor [Sphingomonas crusticola]
MQKLFEIIADPGRRAILDLLRERELAAGEIVGAMKIGQPGVSKHLRLLREAGLVDVRGDRQRRIYSLRPGPLAELDRWLAPYRTFWTGKLDALGAHLDREQ